MLFRMEGAKDAEYHPRVYAYYFKQWNGFRMSFHRHDYTEIMYVISGTCRVETEAESIALKKGEFIVVGYGVAHRLLVDDSCRMLNVEFGFVPGTGEFPSLTELGAGERALGSLLASASPYLVLKDPDEVYHSLRSLVLELDSRGKQGSPLARILLAQLLIRIARLREETAASGLQADDRYVRKSLEFLRQNYDRDIRVGDVAAAVNLHPGYLQRLFKSATGRTLVDMLTSIRMDKAKMLLKQTDIPVTDVYEYVGIGSRQYFHALFKKHTGLTPLEYRESPEAELWNFE
ncbi:helix-turn-helix domain-containing protein [Cohnella sp. CFH 77786]|uniref:AraC family transcriptional regulator n=1 Tax=Cohnella sp. CFH 77786 TaxID=2662265 RepID=UPI001C60EA10|nr:AraC family transcriptional regulator [Cohnella sp. CFH 77786]MBW5449089.1 helix-turn-helix domain-containing protein [Cohnella sp. CFH 77786]